MKKLLFVSNFYYECKQIGQYHLEDVFLTSQLRTSFALSICHPADTEPYEDDADLILVRNGGVVMQYQRQYDAWRKRVFAKQLNTYNAPNGKGDMRGKDYLLALTKRNAPVIPTTDRLDALDQLPGADRFVLKPTNGADSIGFRVVSKAELVAAPLPADTLVQPYIDFQHEVSFYFIDNVFQYALYAPDKQRRWHLIDYQPSETDLAFAYQFIDWNNLAWGIQRIDACRTQDGRLLLMELEDLNPYLSLRQLPPAVRNRFVTALTRSLHSVLDESVRPVPATCHA